MSNGSPFEQTLLERLGSQGTDTGEIETNLNERIKKNVRTINQNKFTPSDNVAKILESSYGRGTKSESRKKGYSPERLGFGESREGKRTTAFASDRPIYEQLGRGLWMGAEGLADQALLGFPETMTDFGERVPEPETHLERLLEMTGETAGFILPFIVTRGATSARAAKTVAGVKTGETVIQTTTRAALREGQKAGKVFKYDKGLFKSADEAMDFVAKSATAGAIRLNNFHRMSAVQKTAFSKQLNKESGAMIKDYARKNGIREIDDSVIRQINKEVGIWWKSIDARPVASLEDLLTTKFMNRKWFQNREQGEKFASWAGTMLEEASLFIMIENMALGIQDMSESGFLFGIEGENQVPIGFRDYLKTSFQAGTFGMTLGWIRNLIPGGIRGGVFKQMKGSNIHNINSLLNKQGTNFAKSIKTTTKEGRNALNTMYRGYGAGIKPDILTHKNTTRNVAEELSKRAGKRTKDLAKLPKTHQNDTSWSALNEIAMNIEGIHSRATLNAVARIQQDGLQHLAKKVSGDLRKAFVKTLKADWFGGTLDGVKIQGSFPRMLAGGTLFGAPSWFDPNISMDDKVFHTMLGMAFLKGGKELQFKGRKVELDDMVHTWHTKDVGIMGRKYGDFPQKLELLSEINATTGVDIGSRSVWGPIFNRVSQERIWEWDSQVPDYQKGANTYTDKVLEKDKSGSYRYLTKMDQKEDGTQKPLAPYEGSWDIKGSESRFLFNYNTWARHMHNIMKDGKSIVPEGYRIKIADGVREINSKEAVSMENMFSNAKIGKDNKGIYSAIDSWRMIENSQRTTFSKKLNLFREELPVEMDKLRQEGKTLNIIIRENDKDGNLVERFSPLNVNNLDTHALHPKEAHLIDKMLGQWNSIVRMFHQNSDLEYGKAGRVVKIDNNTRGLVEWAVGMEKAIERFSDNLKPAGWKKMVDFTDGIYGYMLNTYHRFNSIDKQQQEVNKMNKVNTKEEAESPEQWQVKEALNTIIREGNTPFITDKILVSDHRNSKIAAKQNLFINTIKDMNLNIPGNRAVRPDIMERPTYDTQKRIREGLENKVISSSEISRIMKFFHEKGVTVYSNGNLSTATIEAHNKMVISLMGHDNLKQTKYPILDDQGNITGERLFDSDMFNTIQLLKDIGLVDNHLGLTKEVEIFRTPIHLSKEENIKIDNLFDRVDKEGWEAYEKSLKEEYKDITEQEIKKLKDTHDALKEQFPGEAKVLDEKLKAINEMLDMLTFQHRKWIKNGKEVYSNFGALNPHQKQDVMLMPESQIHSLWNGMQEILTHDYYKSQNEFHSKMTDVGPGKNKELLQKMITRDLMVSKDIPSKMYRAAVMTKLYDPKTKQFVYDKESMAKLTEKYGKTDLEILLKERMKNYNKILNQGWDYSSRQITERMATQEALAVDENPLMQSKLFTLDDVLEYKRSGDFFNIDPEKYSDREILNSLFINNYKGQSKNVKITEFLKDFKKNLLKNNEELRKNPNKVDSMLIKVVGELVNTRDVQRINVNVKKGEFSTSETTQIQRTIDFNMEEKFINGPNYDPIEGPQFLTDPGGDFSVWKIKGDYKNADGKHGTLNNATEYKRIADIAWEEGGIRTLPKNSADLLNAAPKIVEDATLQDAPGLVFFFGNANSSKGDISAFKRSPRLFDNVLQNYLTMLKKDGKTKELNDFVEKHNIQLRIDNKTGNEIQGDWTFGAKNGVFDWKNNSFPEGPVEGRQLFRTMFLSLKRREFKRNKGKDAFYEEIKQSDKDNASEEVRLKLISNTNATTLGKDFVNKLIPFIEGSKIEFEGKENIIDMGKRLTNTHEKGRKIKIANIRDEGIGGKIADLVSVKAGIQRKLKKNIDEAINSTEKEMWEKELIRSEDDFKHVETLESTDMSAGDSYAISSVKMLQFLDYIKYGVEPNESIHSGGIKAHYSNTNQPELFSLYKTFFQKNKSFEDYYMKNSDVEMVFFNTGSKVLNKYPQKYAKKLIEIKSEKDFEKIRDEEYQMDFNIEGVHFIYRKDMNNEAPFAPNSYLHNSRDAELELQQDLYLRVLKEAEKDAKSLVDPSLMTDSIASFKRAVESKQEIEGFFLGERDASVADILARNNAPAQLGGDSMMELMYRGIYNDALNRKEPGMYSTFGADIRIGTDGKFEEPLKDPHIFTNSKGDKEFWQFGELIAPYRIKNQVVPFLKLTFIIPKKGEADIWVHGSDAKKLEKLGMEFPKGLESEGRLSEYLEHGRREDIYEVKVNMYENKGRYSKNGDPHDVWIVKDKAEADLQLQAMKDGQGGAIHFDNKIKKAIDPESGLDILILRDKKQGREDHKYIYIKGSNAYNSLMKERYNEVNEEGNLTGRSLKAVNLKKISKGRKRGAMYTKGGPVDYKVVIWGRRDPYFKYGGIMPMALKDFNLKEHGNQWIVGDKDAFHHFETDMDGDAASLFLKRGPLMAEDMIKNATFAKPTFVREEGANPAYKGFDPYNEVSHLEFAEKQDRASKIRGTYMYVNHIANWFLKNPSTISKKIDIDGKISPYNRFALRISSEHVFLGIRNDLKPFYREVERDVQSTVDTSKGKWDTERYMKTADALINRLLFDKEKGFFVPLSVKEAMPPARKGEQYLDKLALEERPDIDINDYPQAIALMKYIVHDVRKPALSSRNNVHNADGSMRAPKFSDRRKKISKYIDDVRNLEWSTEAKALKKAIGFDNKDSVLHGFGDNADFLSKKSSDKMDTLDRIDYAIYNSAKRNWNFGNTKTNGEQQLDLFIQKFDRKDKENLSDESHYTKVIKNFNESTKEAYEQFLGLERLKEEVSKLEELYHQQSNSTSRNAKNYRNKLKERKFQLRLMEDSMHEYKDIDSYIDPTKKAKLNPKVLQFFDNVKRDWIDKLTKIHFEKKDIAEKNGKEYEVPNKIDIAKEAEKNMLKYGIVWKNETRSDMLEAIAAAKAFGNSPQSTPNYLKRNAREQQQIINDVDIVKKEYDKGIRDELDPEKTPDLPGGMDYLITNAKSKIIQIIKAESKGSDVVTEFILRRWMAPEMSMSTISTYRGHAYPSPKYSNFHKFIKTGFQIIAEVYPKNELRQDSIIGPFVERYRQEVSSMSGNSNPAMTNPKIYHESKKDGGLLYNSYRAEHLTYSKKYTKLELLSSLVPDARHVFGKDITQLDAYESDFLIFGSGLIPNIINNNRITTLPHKAITEASGIYGRDITIDGFKAAFDAMNQFNAHSFAVDRGKGFFLGDAETIGTTRANTDIHPYTEMPKGVSEGPESLKDFERRSQEREEELNDAVKCNLIGEVKGL